MEAYERVEIAESFYLDEVLLWLALGRVPRPMVDREGVDIRLNIDADVDGYVVPAFDHFTRAEFDAAGIDIDFDRYRDDINFLAGLGNLRRNFSLVKNYHCDPEVATMLRYVEQVEDRFSHHFELAKVRILSALLQGELQAQGVGAPLHMNQDEIVSALYRKTEAESGDVTIVPVPMSHWRFDSVNWDERELRSSSRQYVLITVNTEQVLARFPEPLLSAVDTVGREFGGTIIRKARDGRGERGGSHARSKEVAQAVRQEFSARLDRGELPVKREAVYQEAIEWMIVHYDFPVSRATALRYLQSIWNKNSSE